MPRLVVEFSKMNGTGNDFIVIDNRFYHFDDAELSEMAKRFCTRRTGIGADGLLALNVPLGDADFRMRYINADGSIGTMCGNGARCLARFARSAGLHEDPLRFETDAGPHVAYVDDESASVRLSMVEPRDLRREITLEDGLPDVTYVWTGTEHAVTFVEDVASVDVGTIGPLIRREPAFTPTGVNVDFVQVDRDRARLVVRTYEKGVEAETLACGTGAVAAACVAKEMALLDQNRISVDMPGGRLLVTFAEPSAPGVTLEGEAAIVYRGSFEL